MKNPADIIVELESNNSRLFKEEIIIREMKNGNVELFEGIRLACDKLITFGVKDISDYTCDSVTENECTMEDFTNLINKLISRELSGNAAKASIIEYRSKTTSHTWDNWYKRILLKDLKCGIDTKTINKCAKNYPQYKIPVFSCQLAQDSNNHESKMKGNKILQEKLDGTRILTIVYPDGKVDQFSRNGKEVFNFAHIKEEFSQISNTLKEAMVFDGEIMSSSFQALMSQLYRKTDVQTTDSILYVFDIIPLNKFLTGFCEISQIERINMLNQKHSPLHNMKTVKLLDYIMVDLDTDEGNDYFNQFNKKCIDNGKEGIMIKDPIAPYECKRSTSWLKLKPIMTYDLQIVDIQEGTDKYTDMLGALVCKGIEDEKEIFTNVGSGFTDEQRKTFWMNRIDMIGKIVEVKCDVITQNKNGTYSLRFPVFIRIRGFEKGEKL